MLGIAKMVFLKYAIMVLALMTLEFSYAGLISKAVLIGLDSRVVLAPASRVATQQSNQPNLPNLTLDSNIDLEARLDAIPEHLGKQGFTLVSTIFLYVTPGQSNLLTSEYERAKKKFISQVSKSEKEILKLPLELNIVCMQLSNDLTADVHDAIEKNKKLDDDYQYFKELRNCSDFLKRIKGYDLKQANSYRDHSDKLEGMYKDKPSFFTSNYRSVLKFLHLTLRNGQQTVRFAREESAKWLF
jgi:hypothetical protein